MSGWAGITRRGAIKGSAAAAAALAVPLRAAAQAPPPHANRLCYRQPAKEWVEALPVGKGHIGAMKYGVTAGEQLELNTDALWADGPQDPVNPEAREAVPEVRRLIAEGRYDEAQALAGAKLMAIPLTQMPYQAF